MLARPLVISQRGCFQHSFCPYASSLQKNGSFISLFQRQEHRDTKKWYVDMLEGRKPRLNVPRLLLQLVGPFVELIVFGSILSLTFWPDGKQGCVTHSLGCELSPLSNRQVNKVWRWGVIPSHPDSTAWIITHLTVLCAIHAWNSSFGLQVVNERLVLRVPLTRWKPLK